MTEIEFVNFLKTCIDSLKKAKGIGLFIFSFKRTSDTNYRVIFERFDNGDKFEINFYLPAVEKINVEDTEDVLRNGKLVVKKLYQNVKLNIRM